MGPTRAPGLAAGVAESTVPVKDILVDARGPAAVPPEAEVIHMTMRPEPVAFDPILVEKVWGGQRLEEMFRGRSSV
jgi:hypothetical protein